MLRLKDVEWLKHPPEPVMVIGYVPSGAVAAAVIVSVDELPVVLLGLKVNVACCWGTPEALNEMLFAYPFWRLIVTTAELLPPWTRLTEGAVDREKSPMTFSVAEAERITCPFPPDEEFTPFTVMVELPGHAPAETVTVMVEVDGFGPHTNVGLNVAPVTTEGALSVKPTHPLNPPEGVIVTV